MGTGGTQHLDIILRSNKECLIPLCSSSNFQIDGLKVEGERNTQHLGEGTLMPEASKVEPESGDGSQQKKGPWCVQPGKGFSSPSVAQTRWREVPDLGVMSVVIPWRRGGKGCGRPPSKCQETAEDPESVPSFGGRKGTPETDHGA